MSAILQPILQHAVCPISQALMTDPQVLVCGHSFEKEAIEGWMNASQNAHRPLRCPGCRTRFTHINRNIIAKNILDAIPGSSRSIGSMLLSCKRETMRVDPALSKEDADEAVKVFDACRKGDLRLLNKHISRDILVKATREFPVGKIGRTPFHEAAFQGHLNVLIRLCEVAPELLSQNREDGYSLMYASAEGGNKNILEWLYEKDSRLIDHCSLKGKFTLLHAAAKGEDEESIRFLVRTNRSLLSLRSQEHPLGDEKTSVLLGALKGLELEELDLRENQLTEKIAEPLSTCLGKISKELLLGGNSLGPMFFEKIFRDLSLSPLQKLNMKNVSLTDDGASVAASLMRKSTMIKELGLENNQITNEGARELAEALKINASLTALWLNDNQITDDGGRYFFEALQQRKLPLKLNLVGNQIGESNKQMLRVVRTHTVIV